MHWSSIATIVAMVTSFSRSGVTPPDDAGRRARRAAPERAVANDNRTPAGRVERDTVVVNLFVSRADWHLLADDDPRFAFSHSEKKESNRRATAHRSACAPRL